MKKLLIIPFAALALTACGNASETGSSVADSISKTEAVVDAKTKAVLVYADWCGSCKVLDPAVQKAKSMGPLPGVARC